MNSLKRIISLAKKTALRILNEKDIDPSEIDEIFSKNDTDDIINNLTNTNIKKEREEQLKYINKTKYSDWQNIKPNSLASNKSFKYVYKFAAILILCLTLGYVSYKNINRPSQISSDKNTIGLPFNDIVLDLGNGEKEIISDNSPQKTISKNGSFLNVEDGFKLDYSNSNKSKFSEKLIYNELTIPYGRNLQVILSDGSKVTLNSGSTLRYPINFIKGENRTVYLKGEAFFDVETNKKQPFIVHTNNMNITVLGTKFNVSSYPEDPYINTVLVEGSVAISPNSNPKRTTILKPGDKAEWVKQNMDINLKTVDTSIYTAWTEGRVVFEHMPFKNITKKLERRYNVSITNNNTSLDNEDFTASFDIETIEQVLNSFSKNYTFDYNIKGNNITIN
ncbi:FecR family protein [Flavivirga algicola]|uniref:DUF4974 domain-containing protein n=1 Tax=Flavivirga algicola TaxID=2729136 RepID=A0ABX1S0D4_9FLAO|nr:FecR family protein [Flavivirga algicola]NMH89306.1 DUF4974 domain-containing protein [Flavivirga algicola]